MDTPANTPEPNLTLERADGLYRGYDVLVTPAMFKELSRLTDQDMGVSLRNRSPRVLNPEPLCLEWGRGSKAIKGDATDKKPLPRLIRGGDDPWNVPGMDMEAHRIYDGETATSTAQMLIDRLKTTELHPFDRKLLEDLNISVRQGDLHPLNTDFVSLQLRDVARERQEKIVAELLDRIKKRIATTLLNRPELLRHYLIEPQNHQCGVSFSDLEQPVALIERDLREEKAGDRGSYNDQDHAQILRFYWARRIMQWIHFALETALRDELEITGTVRRSTSDRPGSGETRPIRKDEFKPRFGLQLGKSTGNIDLSIAFRDGLYTGSSSRMAWIKDVTLTGAQFKNSTSTDSAAS